ncbi:NADH dehydrogenase [ubiquinone] 1 beta subcomplex subunit 11, mitochondrial-like [Varroa destructor]|uniref:NADH dehydrogenase [ubiquinone] 1 beta subcomplex subunit 11, mitochondrial n=1 Tax=Varroa destructor TaxID=109461 RepID=A0A7M7JZ12_VARDE|nr:NADH dehydrogenase [ubiquinone] 1 beta subcomplex subunit 11, mitochondrial-like [Varroa destructor]
MILCRLASVRRLNTLRPLTAQRPQLVAVPTTVSTGHKLVRWISSSEKKPATHVGNAPDTVIDNPPRTAEDFAEAATKSRNWISYGYNIEDIEDDRDMHALVMFCMVSIGLVGTTFLLGYLPDFRDKDWAHREAFLELARREKYGRPLIDKEFIPVERIHLPSEEELEGVEVYL